MNGHREITSDIPLVYHTGTLHQPSIQSSLFAADIKRPGRSETTWQLNLPCSRKASLTSPKKWSRHFPTLPALIAMAIDSSPYRRTTKSTNTSRYDSHIFAVINRIGRIPFDKFWRPWTIALWKFLEVILANQARGITGLCIHPQGICLEVVALCAESRSRLFKTLINAYPWLYMLIWD